jgi:beta-carotene/zeaxanthin 4-ketolase
MLGRYVEKGVWIAIALLTAWAVSLFFLLQWQIDWANPLTYFLFLLQTHLYTGIFITAHDAMHGSVSKNRWLNHLIGRIATILFAYNFYDNLYGKHHLHHRFVATDDDPDYHEGNFWVWYYNFAKQYINPWQLLLMAATYHGLQVFFEQSNVIWFWMLPSIASTFQLFYFGTYLPHRQKPDNKHHSRSQAKNHIWAFVSCYFFGYHYEHHNSPATPWWKLHREKEKTS